MKDWAEKLNGAQAKATARALQSLSNLVNGLERMNETTAFHTVKIPELHLALGEAKAVLNSKLEEYFEVTEVTKENLPFPEYVAGETYSLITCDTLPDFITDDTNHIGLYRRSAGFTETRVVAVSTNGRKIDIKSIKHGSDILDQCGSPVALVQFGVMNFNSTKIGSQRLGYFVRVQDIKTYDLGGINHETENTTKG